MIDYTVKSGINCAKINLQTIKPIKKQTYNQVLPFLYDSHSHAGYKVLVLQLSLRS